MSSHHDLHRFLYKIAQAYYIEGLNQQQIAKRFQISRPKVSRMLQKAKDEKVVSITILPPVGRLADVESDLEKKFKLDEAVVVQVSHGGDAISIARELGASAVDVVVRSIQHQNIVAMAWGSTILNLVDAMPSLNSPETTIVQMIGGLDNRMTNEHSAELVRRTAQKLNAQFRLIPAPGIVTNLVAAKALIKDFQIAETLALAEQAKVAIVGLGILSNESVLVKSSELLSHKDLRLLEEVGAVGDVILRFLDENGKPLSLDINKRIIGLSLEQLKNIPRVIAIAGGPQKFKIILAALRGQLVNVLVTDHVTAEQLLHAG